MEKFYVSHRETYNENVFIKSAQAKNEAPSWHLRKRRIVDDNGYTTEKIAKETGLSAHSAGFVLKTDSRTRNGLNG